MNSGMVIHYDEAGTRNLGPGTKNHEGTCGELWVR